VLIGYWFGSGFERESIVYGPHEMVSMRCLPCKVDGSDLELWFHPHYVHNSTSFAMHRDIAASRNESSSPKGLQDPPSRCLKFIRTYANAGARVWIGARARVALTNKPDWPRPRSASVSASTGLLQCPSLFIVYI